MYWDGFESGLFENRSYASLLSEQFKVPGIEYFGYFRLLVVRQCKKQSFDPLKFICRWKTRP